MDGRVRLRQWLEGRLNTGYIPGLVWLDKSKGIFKIPWKHHSKHTWHEDDAAIFKDWAVVTGRFREGLDAPDWPMWKTRLRCALNKAPDIEEARQHHNLHCDEPFKVYRFVSRTESVWRANASRHASLIFDGAPKRSQFPITEISRSSNLLPTPQITTNITTALNPSKHVTANTVHRKPITLIRKSHNGAHITLKCISLPLSQSQRNKQHNHRSGLSISSLPLPPTTSTLKQHLYKHSLHNKYNTDYLGTPSLFSLTSTPSPYHHPLDSSPSQSTISNSLKFTDIIEPELHQICLRIQHLEHRVSDMIINNPNGCCIYFGKFDESLSSSGPEPIEPQLYPFVRENDKYCVDMLLDNMARGVVLSTQDGCVYAEKLCKCATFVYRPVVSSQSVPQFELVEKLTRRKRVCVFDYRAFLRQLVLYQQGVPGVTLPSVELVLAFGQQIREGSTPDSLYIWCRVASCKAWFLVQKNGFNRANNCIMTSSELMEGLCRPVEDEVMVLAGNHVDYSIEENQEVRETHNGRGMQGNNVLFGGAKSSPLVACSVDEAAMERELISITQCLEQQQQPIKLEMKQDVIRPGLDPSMACLDEFTGLISHEVSIVDEENEEIDYSY